MGGGFGPACCCIRAVCRWLVLNDRLWTLFSHLFGEVGLGVGAIATPPHKRSGSSPRERGKRGKPRQNQPRVWIIPACAGKTLARGKLFLICECTTENAQILENSGCGFAVFSGVADKNASEPAEQSAR